MSDDYLNYLQSEQLDAPVLESFGDSHWAVVRLPGWPGWEMGVYIDHRGELAGFKINPAGAHDGRHIAATPEGGLTVELLRAVRLGELNRTARRLLAEESRLAAAEVPFDLAVDDGGRLVVDDPDGEGRATVQRLLDRAKVAEIEIKRTGRKGTPDITYARVAARYVDKLATEAKPIVALAQDLMCSVSQAKSQVLKAREKGFLTSSRQGKAGGALTARAIELLQEDHT